MAWIIGESFDFYAANADAGSLWDTVGAGWSLSASGRFTGSQALLMGLSSPIPVYFTKASGSNDQTHHIVVSHRQTGALAGTVAYFYFTLSDGVTAQCTFVFRSDGAILLQAGAVGGATLATYSSAFIAGVWNGFEFEIKIHNSTGEFHVRKNGNTADDFSATGLDTQASANAYANKLSIGGAGSNNTSVVALDDIMWFSTSGAAPNTWVGDIRSVQLMPVSDASVQFSRFPNPVSLTPYTTNRTFSKAANLGLMSPFTASTTGTISSGSVTVTTGGTGNLKVAIYDSTRTTVLATSNAVVNPISGANAITFGTPLAVTAGTVYYFAVDQDFTVVYTSTNAGTPGYSFTTTYASFPAAGPVTASGADSPIYTVSIVPTINYDVVNQAQQDGLTSYVFDSVVGHADFYNVADLPTVPASVIGVVTRGFVAKSDAGAKSAQLQLKSGATTVQSTTLVLSTSFVYTSRVDTTDPNTGSAWTPAAINALQVGPYVTA